MQSRSCGPLKPHNDRLLLSGGKMDERVGRAGDVGKQWKIPHNGRAKRFHQLQNSAQWPGGNFHHLTQCTPLSAGCRALDGAGGSGGGGEGVSG
jgi:hypothetical protein